MKLYYLFIAAVVIVLSMYFFNSFGPSVVDLTEHNAKQIRKAGNR